PRILRRSEAASRSYTLRWQPRLATRQREGISFRFWFPLIPLLRVELILAIIIASSAIMPPLQFTTTIARCIGPAIACIRRNDANDKISAICWYLSVNCLDGCGLLGERNIW